MEQLLQMPNTTYQDRLDRFNGSTTGKWLWETVATTLVHGRWDGDLIPWVGWLVPHQANSSLDLAVALACHRKRGEGDRIWHFVDRHTKMIQGHNTSFSKGSVVSRMCSVQAFDDCEGRGKCGWPRR